QLNLLKLLSGKFRKTTIEPVSAEETTEGFLNLYLTMKGPATDPVIQYDKQAVKEKIASDLKEEKNLLKDVLKKEFDKQQNDQREIKDYQPARELQYMQYEDDTLATGNGEKQTPSSTQQ